MRVALVCGYDWAVPGGVQSQLDALARALAEAGHDVAVVAPVTARAGRPTPGAGPGEGFLLFPAGRSIGLPVNGSIAPVAPTPAAAVATRRALRRFRPDVVHVHEPLVPGPPLAAVLGGPRPVVVTFHRADSDVLYRAEGRLLGPLLGRRVDAATAVSEAAIATARTVLGQHLPSIIEVRNGVDLRRGERARLALARVSGEAGAPYKNGSRPRVVYAGRHEPRKGVAVLVGAARRLGPDVEVVIAGDGPERTSLERQAAADPAVRFVGRLEDEPQAELVASADVFVAPAVGGESFGLVLLEAMAAGTCVVASDIPGYRLAAAGAAVLVAPGDSAALAACVSDVLADHEKRRRAVELGLARARECAIETVMERYVEVYRAAGASG